jgi:hypothetical protein
MLLPPLPPPLLLLLLLLLVICSEEGFLAFWKGNGVNIIRIFPYSAGEQRIDSFLV